MQHWYAIHTKPRREREALENLERQGYQIYLPQIRVRKFIRRTWQYAVEPLFPRYLFVHLDLEATNTEPIRSTKGVSQLVKFGDKAVPVADEIIEFLQNTADSDTGIHQSAVPSIQPGEKVAIVDGALQGLEGVFEQDSGEDRVMVLIDVLGRLNRIAVARRDIAPTDY
jgi:transcriptional antiterminator RfaH